MHRTKTLKTVNVHQQPPLDLSLIKKYSNKSMDPFNRVSKQKPIEFFVQLKSHFHKLLFNSAKMSLHEKRPRSK